MFLDQLKINRGLDRIQTGLDIAGLIPGVGIIPDALNAVIHAARGNTGGALTSLGAMIPGVGQGITTGKHGIKGIKYASKYRNYNVNKLLRSFNFKKQYRTKKNIVKEGSTNMNLREAIASFRNSVKPETVTRPKAGVRTGQLPNGNQITIRTIGDHGPTVEIETGKKEITKIRIKG